MHAGTNLAASRLTLPENRMLASSALSACKTARCGELDIGSCKVNLQHSVSRQAWCPRHCHFALSSGVSRGPDAPGNLPSKANSPMRRPITPARDSNTTHYTGTDQQQSYMAAFMALKASNCPSVPRPICRLRLGVCHICAATAD